MALDYGQDFSCVDDFEEEMRVISDPALLVGQALVRRWSCPRGMLLDDENYGTDLREFLNEDIDQLSLIRMRAEARAEAEKDERVINCNVASSSYDQATGKVTMSFSVELADRNLQLVISVTNLTVELLSVE